MLRFTPRINSVAKRQLRTVVRPRIMLLERREAPPVTAWTYQQGSAVLASGAAIGECCHVHFTEQNAHDLNEAGNSLVNVRAAINGQAPAMCRDQNVRFDFGSRQQDHDARYELGGIDLQTDVGGHLIFVSYIVPEGAMENIGSYGARGVVRVN